MWARLLEAANAIPLPLSNAATHVGDVLEELALDAVILTGGNDLPSETEPGNFAPERDALEEQVLTWVRTRGVPTLGVCRGMQMLSRWAGGTVEPVDGHVATSHAIRSEARGLHLPTRVNSYHDKAVVEVPADMYVLARATDSVVEAVRMKDAPIVGVMWHPERGERQCPLALMTALLQA